MSIMKMSNIKVEFKNKKVLDKINVKLKGGKLTFIIGPNGTGKTTFIKTIADMVKYDGEIITLDSKGKKVSKNSISYVPQMTGVLSNLTVFEMVLLGRVQELGWKVKKEHLKAVEEVLEQMELLDISRIKFSNLSGGQKQLVIMAQSLISRPKVLLLDEPTSALDIKHQLEVLEIAEEYTKKYKIITLVIIHDLTLAARYSDEIILLNNGNIVTSGTAKEVLIESVLEEVYDVKVDIDQSKSGYLTVMPISKSKKLEVI